MAIIVTFKKCPKCGLVWNTREDFLKDKGLAITGYDANLEALALGSLIFSHSCGAAFPMNVEGFSDLYNGPIYRERRTGSAECLGYCKKRDELRPCPVRCECAWVRELIQVINKMK